MMDSLHPKQRGAFVTFLSQGVWHAVLIVVLSLVAFCLIFGAGVYAWAQSYENKMPPNTSIAGRDVSGSTPEEVRTLLQQEIDDVITEGVPVRVNEEEKTLVLATLVTTDLQEYVHFELEEAIAQGMDLYEEHPAKNAWSLLLALREPRQIPLNLDLRTDVLQQTILNMYPDMEVLSQPAGYKISAINGGWDVNVLDGTEGTEFQWEDFFLKLETQLSVLNNGTLELKLKDQDPRIASYEAASQIEDTLAILEQAPYRYTFEEESREWELTAADLATMLQPGEDEMPTVDEEAFLSWFEEVAHSVNQEAQNARLNVAEGRVTDFIASKEGRTVDQDDARQQLIAQFMQGTNESMPLSVEVKPPDVTTADVNDLGITEILGVGTSSYAGSPSNRRANIQNGVDLLNGRLIAPGETFSLIEALSPFTYENGYLPELVIKGDEIVPEMGGGLCQIGSTTFRATMNAGLEVTERRNHSLVVSYYNDQTNGLPGTDATIYDPAPDYKFTNDTEHYVLFQAENLVDTSELRFTFWGTSDGRQASYSPPVVHRWIPVGPTQYIETDSLAPGEEECQYEHIGADASFTYTIIRPTGEVDERVFESHYRPLPRICLIGSTPEDLPEDDTVEDEENTEAPTSEEEQSDLEIETEAT